MRIGRIERNIGCRLFLAVMFAFGLAATSWVDSDAKKIRQSLKIEKDKKSAKGKGKEAQTKSMEEEFEGIKVNVLKGDEPESGNDGLVFSPEKVSFSGYDKQATSTIESFLVTNNSQYDISAVKVRIYYKDMKGRMLHSRDISKKCHVKKGETRKLDVSTWDKQKSYYYYLSNEPRRVSTPYQVDMEALAYWILPEGE